MKFKIRRTNLSSPYRRRCGVENAARTEGRLNLGDLDKTVRPVSASPVVYAFQDVPRWV